MPECVIVNTSPLFYLHRIGHFELFRQLYGEITVPEAVMEELYAGERTGEDVPLIQESSWVRIESVNIPGFISVVPDLGNGEAEVISLALKKGAALVILDDALGRQIARLQSLKLTGTAGILLRSKERGFIPAVKPLLEQLITAGFYLSESLMRDILEIAGE